MSQHDLVIDNASGAAVRADLNNALAALGSSMKGPNAPPSPLAGMIWVDDDTPSATVWTVKQYDGAEWIQLGRLDITANIYIPSEGVIAWADVASAATVDLGAQASRSLRITGTTTITSFGTAASGVRKRLRIATGLTVTHNAASLICPGAANLVLVAGDVLDVESLGSGNWVVVAVQRAAGLPVASMATARVLGRLTAGSGAIEEIPLGNTAAATVLGISRGTEQATTSGTAIDFTGIPAGVRRITVLLNAVSTNGGSNLALRLGTSGGIVSTGYSGILGYWGSTSNAYGALSNAFLLANGSAADTITGRWSIENISGNNWMATFTGFVSNGANLWVQYCSGVVPLSGLLTQLRLTTETGTPTFDNGAMNIFWEF